MVSKRCSYIVHFTATADKKVCKLYFNMPELKYSVVEKASTSGREG